MRLIINIILLNFLTLPCLAQTKAIAYKSHSGSAANYKAALLNDAFLAGDAGFGVPAYRSYKYLKSVKYIGQHTVVIATAFYRSHYSDTVPDKLVRVSYDTVLNKDLFKPPFNMEKIKTTLFEQHHYNNDINKAEFIGFKNAVSKTKHKKNKDIKPYDAITATEPDTANIAMITAEPFINKPAAFTHQKSNSPWLLIILFSLIAGWLSNRLYKPLYRLSV